MNETKGISIHISDEKMTLEGNIIPTAESGRSRRVRDDDDTPLSRGASFSTILLAEVN
jgi:hypothetical protein